MLNINHSLQPKALVFWLHGLGADCHDFGPIVNFLNLPDFEFILPNAPIRPITLNNGMTMRGWYDIESLDFKTIDLKGLEESRMMIEKLIQQSLGSKTNQPKIFMAGFSQGAALSLYINEFSNIQFDGIIALSGYLPKKNELKTISCQLLLYMASMMILLIRILLKIVINCLRVTIISNFMTTLWVMRLLKMKLT